MNRLTRVLNAVPRVLSSKPHILFLAVLGVFLVVLPVLHLFTPSASAMLIGGNYTNVTSDLGACIAAGGTVHLVKRDAAHRKSMADLHQKVDDLHDQLNKEQP